MTTKTITAILALAFISIGLAAPAAAQPQEQNAPDTPDTSEQGIMTALTQMQSQLDRVTQQLQDVQQRLNSIEERVPAAQQNAGNEAQENQGPPENAGKPETAGKSNGAEVDHSVEIENGTKTIQHEVTKNGETLVSWVKQINVFEGEEEAEPQELRLELEGNATPGNNVTLNAFTENRSIANATVEINDEKAGTTDSSGQYSFTVPEAEELEIEVESGEMEGELEYEFEESEEESEEDSEEAEESDEEENETEEEVEE